MYNIILSWLILINFFSLCCCQESKDDQLDVPHSVLNLCPQKKRIKLEGEFTEKMEDPCYFDTLPNEAVVKIFSYVDPIVIEKNLRLVCSRWKEIVDSYPWKLNDEEQDSWHALLLSIETLLKGDLRKYGHNHGLKWLETPLNVKEMVRAKPSPKLSRMYLSARKHMIGLLDGEETSQWFSRACDGNKRVVVWRRVVNDAYLHLLRLKDNKDLLKSRAESRLAPYFHFLVINKILYVSITSSFFKFIANKEFPKKLLASMNGMVYLASLNKANSDLTLFHKKLSLSLGAITEFERSSAHAWAKKYFFSLKTLSVEKYEKIQNLIRDFRIRNFTGFSSFEEFMGYTYLTAHYDNKVKDAKSNIIEKTIEKFENDKVILRHFPLMPISPDDNISTYHNPHTFSFNDPTLQSLIPHQVYGITPYGIDLRAVSNIYDKKTINPLLLYQEPDCTAQTLLGDDKSDRASRFTEIDGQIIAEEEEDDSTYTGELVIDESDQEDEENEYERKI